MADFSNIVTGLKIPSQLPLDNKTTVINELALKDLGLNQNLAFTYYDGLIVRCIQEDTYYKWKQVVTGQENTGLLITDFIYPNNLIVFNVDYSLKRYNFVKQTYMSLDKLPIINSPAGTVIVNYVDSQTITLEVKPTIANGSQTKVSAGQNVTILGTGTTLDPYIVSSFTNINAGSGITITGLGTTLNPYLITSKSDLQYDTKEIVCDSLYLSNNFDLTPGITMGLGKNLRLGWAIMNGNNGTLNDDGRVVVGYGTSYNILNDTAGSKDAVVVAHNHTVNAVRTTSVALPEGGSGAYGTNQTLTTSTVGESGIDKNMQPYVVRLRIMKL